MKLKEETFTGTNDEINQHLLEIYQRMKKSVEKKKILFLVDNQNWCWTQTAKSIAANLPQYSFSIVSAKEFKRDFDSLVNSHDMVYMRGYPFIFLRGMPKLPIPFIYTIATGGENLDKRITQSMDYADRGFACITQNEKTKIELEKLDFKNIHVIPNGIDAELFKPLFIDVTSRDDSSKKTLPAYKEYCVGFAGNNSGFRAELKGTGFVKSACESLQVSYIETTLENRLPYSRMPEFYNSIKIYAQPSDSEGCSNSVMEALACGVPCLICEGVGYHGEECRGGGADGVLFVRRDIEDIAGRIKFLMGDSAAHKQVSGNARAFALKHSWDKIAPMHGEIIRQALESAPVIPVKTKTELQSECHVKTSCHNCRSFLALKDMPGCGLCGFDRAAIILKHKNMNCDDFKIKGEL